MPALAHGHSSAQPFVRSRMDGNEAAKVVLLIDILRPDLPWHLHLVNQLICRLSKYATSPYHFQEVGTSTCSII